jgi:adenine-specific DNA-methyltransferase
MAKIEDLIAQIPDERLRIGIAAEVKALKKTKKFGLVFEEHLPETVRLPRLPVKPGELVSLKREAGNRLWRVKTIHKNIATCDRAVTGYPGAGEANQEFPVADLVVVRSFGDAIYPALVPVDRVERGGPDKPWHLLINADNFHALQLLLYCYEGKVDVIYIDPPYNTGARDWKYNNDYVDKGDSFRHSKWLSMLKKRITLAKRLLKPSGVMIVTIDEHEVHHLGALLEEHLPEYTRQMVTIVINEKGVAQGRLSRVEEYAFFCFGPQAVIPPQNDDLLAPDRKDSKRFSVPRWEWLLRGGTNSRRADRKQLFFPIYIDPTVPKIIGFGEPLPFDDQPELKLKDERHIAWPFRTDGSLGNWRVSPGSLREYLKKGYVKLGGYDEGRKTWTILYLGRKGQKQIEEGAVKIKGSSGMFWEFFIGRDKGLIPRSGRRYRF